MKKVERLLIQRPVAQTDFTPEHCFLPCRVPSGCARFYPHPQAGTRAQTSLNSQTRPAKRGSDSAYGFIAKGCEQHCPSERLLQPGTCMNFCGWPQKCSKSRLRYGLIASRASNKVLPALSRKISKGRLGNRLSRPHGFCMAFPTGMLPSCKVVFLNSSFNAPLQLVINELFTKKLDIFKSYGIMKDSGRILPIIGICYGSVK